MRSEVMNNRTVWRRGKRKRKRGCDSQTLTPSDQQCIQQSQGDAYFRVVDFLLKPIKGRKNRYRPLNFVKLGRDCAFQWCARQVQEFAQSVGSRHLLTVNHPKTNSLDLAAEWILSLQSSCLTTYILCFLLWILFVSFSHSSTLPWPFFISLPLCLYPHLTSNISYRPTLLYTFSPFFNIHFIEHCSFLACDSFQWSSSPRFALLARRFER